MSLSIRPAVEHGAAPGAPVVTTPGDPTTVTRAEVLGPAAGGSGRADR